MAQTEPWTIQRLLNWTTERFAETGSPSPRLDAEVLLAHACGCQRIELYTRFDQLPEEDQLGQFRELVRQRCQGKPVAYLVEHREFYSMDFRVTPAVLIPRPETEFLVIDALDLAKQASANGQPLRVADVGTGSGAIAIAVAKHVPEAEVTAIDISSAALAVARENAEAHGVHERIAFVEGDLFQALPPETEFDMVLSNPPYIGECERAELPADVVDHEPELALFGGPDGTDVVRRLIEKATTRIVPGGWLLIEIGPRIEEATLEIVRKSAAYEAVNVTKDLSGFARVVRCRRNPPARSA